jgi:hypothetical protein
MTDKTNLIFYCYPRKGAMDDFRDVAERINASSGDVRARVLPTTLHPGRLVGTVASALRPTVSIEMDRLKRLRPLRGYRYSHLRIGKDEEMARLAQAGIPVPRWANVEPGVKLDASTWGPYVVVKPRLGVRGAFVWIHRTGKVRHKPPEAFPEGHPARGGLVAQQFIYTGAWPVAYRVLSYLGRPLSATRYDGRRDMAPLQSAEGFRDSGGRSIVANAMGCTISLTDDPDILDMSRRVHAAFPNVPSLGIDLIRDANTGLIYVLEVNPRGDSWSLSSNSGRAIQAQFNIDFYKQFGALDLICEASLDAARRHAI